MIKIEFEINEEEGDMLRAAYNSNLKLFPNETLNDTAKRVMLASLVMEDAVQSKQMLDEFTKRFAKEVINKLKDNPDLIRQAKKAFEDAANEDAKKWVRDKFKK